MAPRHGGTAAPPHCGAATGDHRLLAIIAAGTGRLALTRASATGGLAFLTLAPYVGSMKATLTSKGQITIPAPIRRKLGLAPGQVLDFDESAPYLKAVPIFDEDEMTSVLGCATNARGHTSRSWLDQTRGPVKLPSEHG